LGSAWMALRGWGAPEVWAAFDPALTLATSLGRTETLLPILWGRWFHVQVQGRLPEAVQLANEMLELAATAGNSALRIVGHTASAWSYFWLGQLVTAREHANMVLSLYDEAQHGHIVDLTNHDPKTMAGINASNWIWMLGYPDQAAKVSHAADDHARRRGHPFDLGYALGSFGSWVFEYRGEPGVLFARAEECERIGRENSLSFFFEVQAPRTRAVALIRTGRLAEGIAQFSKYIDPPMTTGDMRPYMLTILAEATALAGDHNRSLRLVEEAIEQAQTSGSQGHAHHAESLRIKGFILEQMGKRDEAERQYRAAIDFACRQQAKSWELRASISLAGLLCARGEHGLARELLIPIYGWFTEGFDTKDLKEAAVLLKKLGA
jgi:tetratricopeptide (TPR) repeat protein